MSISSLSMYQTLVNEWNDIVNSVTQINSWVDMTLLKISVLQNDPNYSANIDTNETNYLNNFINVLNTFKATQPINPDQ